MDVGYDAAIRFFEKGDFLQLVSASGRTTEELRALEPRHRVIVANALALVGQVNSAKRLAEVDLHSSSPAAVRSQAELTLAVVSRRLGDHASAVRHAQAAASLAEESSVPERIAWAHLHLFRLLIEVGPIDEVLVTLPKLRRSVANAGVNHLSAYLHTCLSVLEGQIGHPDEARRHCDVADSLLERSPNTWLSASSLLNRGCVACLNCEFEAATRLLRSARTLAQESGHASLTLAAEASGGHVQLLVGEFAKAENSLTTVLYDEQSDATSQLGALDGLARIYLALNQLEDVERVLRELRARVN